MLCPICKQEIKDNSKFCGKCGNIIPRCPTCGKVIDKRVRFCVYDGTPLPEEIVALISDEPQKESDVPKKKIGFWVLLSVMGVLAATALIIGYLLYDSGKIDLFREQETALEIENNMEEETELDAAGQEIEQEEMEIAVETESVESHEVESERILEKLQEAVEITRIVYGAYSKYLDEQDVIQANYFGMENWPYKCVIYPDINSIKDFEELLKNYYTDNQVADYLSILQYVEQDGKLYIAEADGLGGLGVAEYRISITPETDELYKIVINSKYVGEEIDEIPEELNYRLTDKGWKFDQGIFLLSEAPMVLEGEAKGEVNQEEDSNPNVLNSQLKIYSYDEAIKSPGLYLHHTGYSDYKNSTQCTYIRFNEGTLIEGASKKVVSIDVEKDIANPMVKSNMGSYVFIDNSAVLVMHDFKNIKKTSIGNIYSVEEVYYDSATSSNNYVMGDVYVYTLWDLDVNGAKVQTDENVYQSLPCVIMSKIPEGVCIVKYTMETWDGEFKEYYVPVHLTETKEFDTLDTSLMFS